MMCNHSKTFLGIKPEYLNDFIEKNFQIFIESHSQRINIITVTPDNKLVITSSEKEIKVWSTFTHQGVSKLLGHSETVICLEATSDYLLSSSLDLSIRIWDLHLMTQCFILKSDTQRLFSLALSHDNIFFASGSQVGEIKLYDFEGKLLVFDENLHNNEVKFLKFSQTLPILYSASVDGMLILTNVQTHSKVYSQNIAKGSLFKAYLSHDEKKIISCRSNDQVISLWDLNTWTCTQFALPNKLADSKVVLTSDNCSFIYVTKDHTLVSLLLSKKQPPHILLSHTAKITDLALLSNTIYSVSFDRTVKMHNLLTNQTLSFYGHTLPITYFKYNPMHNLLITSSLDKTIRLWNLNTKNQERVLSIKNSFVNYLSISPDFSVFLVNCATGDIIIYDLPNNTQKSFLLEDIPKNKSISLSKSKNYLIGSCPRYGCCFIYKLSILLSN